ncbi:hypothetical protein [Tengunoibacter tsumagoiensis]|uniref:Uncharacterized protein n=1 Tax=Tengunoibacter tsumagoiensis TaxID=2014871 RepID=A0A402A2M8_9CHLR|nr:hypothetical protein [Tengunoibacter tsumagoiensis]GCE13309.1 hypothetical protein KTT_31680 [Tengunoibacter tsumagoiensis]
MLDLLEFTYGRYNGGQTAPIGSYLNPRTFCIFQQSTDGILPLDGTFVRVDPSGSQTFTAIASNLNTLLNTTYTAASFHACSGGDATVSPGTMSNDA